MACDFYNTWGDEVRHKAEPKLVTYFIEDPFENAIKIGETIDVVRRYGTLRQEFIKAGNIPAMLRLVGHVPASIISERRLHSLLASARFTHPTPHVGATEWFHMEDPMVALCFGLLVAGGFAGRNEELDRYEFKAARREAPLLDAMLERMRANLAGT